MTWGQQVSVDTNFLHITEIFPLAHGSNAASSSITLKAVHLPTHIFYFEHGAEAFARNYRLMLCLLPSQMKMQRFHQSKCIYRKGRDTEENETTRCEWESLLWIQPGIHPVFSNQLLLDLYRLYTRRPKCKRLYKLRSVSLGPLRPHMHIKLGLLVLFILQLFHLRDFIITCYMYNEIITVTASLLYASVQCILSLVYNGRFMFAKHISITRQFKVLCESNTRKSIIIIK